MHIFSEKHCNETLLLTLFSAIIYNDSTMKMLFRNSDLLNFVIGASFEEHEGCFSRIIILANVSYLFPVDQMIDGWTPFSKEL